MSSKSIYRRIPYFYIIRHKPSGLLYAGCKFNKDANPDKLLKVGGYLTSSKLVKSLISLEGIDTFEIVDIILEEEITIPFGWSTILEFESHYLRKNNCASNKLYINKSNNAPRSPNVKGKSLFFDDIGNKQFMDVILAKSLEYKSCRSGKLHHMYGKMHSDDFKHNMSLRITGDLNPMYGRKREDLANSNKDPELKEKRAAGYRLSCLKRKAIRFGFSSIQEMTENINNIDNFKLKELYNTYGSGAQIAYTRAVESLKKLDLI